MPLKLVFFGTPDAAVKSLSALLDSGHRVAAVVTAPDRPRGRGMKVEPSPVKQLAIPAGVPVLQPETLRSAEAVEELAGWGAGAFVVVAFGLILPAGVLNIPSLGCLNVHFSLLPMLRGAAPVQWALINGHDTTGVTIMRMDAGVDTGPILAQSPEPIVDSDDAGSLGERLAGRGARLLIETLDALERGALEPKPQDDSMATQAPKLSSGDSRIDWGSPALEISRRVRAASPRPGGWSMFGPGRVKIWKTAVTDVSSGDAPGSIVRAGERLVVSTASSDLELIEVQPEGKRRMSAAEFVRGYRPNPGDRFS